MSLEKKLFSFKNISELNKRAAYRQCVVEKIGKNHTEESLLKIAKQKEVERLAKQREEEIIELARVKEQLIAEREQKEKDDAIRLQKEIEAQAELERVKSELEQKSIEVDKNKNELITVFSVWNKETEKYEDYQDTGLIIEDVEQVPVFQVYNTTTNADVEIDYIAKNEMALDSAKKLISEIVNYCDNNGYLITEPLISKIEAFLR